MRYLVLIGMLVGCGKLEIDQRLVVPAPVSAPEAIRVVLASYGSNGSGVPPITWYRPDDQGPCAGFGFVDPQDGTCVLGLEDDALHVFADSGEIVVMVSPDLHKSYVVLAHELAHWRWGGDFGEGHPAPIFGDYATTGVYGGAAGRAIAKLAEWEATCQPGCGASLE